MRSSTRKIMGTATIVLGLLSGTSLVLAQETQAQGQEPAYNSSIKVPNGEGESGEAGQLATQAKIDAAQAMTAATTKVPGTVLQVSLDNENGNLIYSVEVKTASNEIIDVKVDAGNGSVLGQDTPGTESEQGGEQGGEGEANGEGESQGN